MRVWCHGQIPIQIRTNFLDGRVEYDGLWTAACIHLSGLALHRDMVDTGWTITHIESGLRVMPPIKTKKVARAILLDLAPLIDWHQTAQELTDNAENLRLVMKIAAEH